MVALLCRARSCGIKNSLWLVLITALLCLFIYHLNTKPTVPRAQVTEYVTDNPVRYDMQRDKSNRNVTTRKLVLLIYDATCRSIFQKIRTLLQAQRIAFETYFYVTGKLPRSLNSYNRRFPYSLVIFSSLHIYQQLPKIYKEQYHYFSKYSNAGIIFVTDDVSGSIEVGDGATLSMYKFNAEVKNFYVYPTKYLHISKGDFSVSPNEVDWTFLNVNSGRFDPIASIEYVNQDTQQSVTYPVILADDGYNDGVRRVFIGNPLDSWIVKLLLLDAIQYFSARPMLKFDLKRYILVDIDDIFVAPPGTRMKVDDVKALITTQNNLRSKVPGFTFNLGYAGYFYDKGLDEEVKGKNIVTMNFTKLQ